MLNTIEIHPIPPFLPRKAKFLMLGSFPPKKEKWSMDFFYPNFQNDMWRILGLIFFCDKNYFLKTTKSFDKNKIIRFLTREGIAVADVAKKVIREKNNASDDSLIVVEPIDIESMLSQLPFCTTVIATGQKATDVLAQLFAIDKQPKIGEYSTFYYQGRFMKLFRMPSSSRAYPKSIEYKANKYKIVFS